MDSRIFFEVMAALGVMAVLGAAPGSRMARAEEAAAPEPVQGEWSNHFQLTTVTQLHGSFTAPYSGQLSLNPIFESPTSFTSTLFVGHRLWKDASIFVNPEESAGSGLSQTHGVAAFPNGEIYRVDDPSPKLNLSRLFYRQDIGLGGGKVRLEDEPNQFGDIKDANRVTLIAGKFSLNDYFDDNTYSHDPRSQFLNWALMDTAAWDYAADTRGYTWGIYGELRLAQWSLRLATVEEPAMANGLDMDGNIVHAHGDNAQLEYRYQVSGHSGVIRAMGYMNHANMGNYRQAIQQASGTGLTPDITSTRSYSTKYGAGISWEQELTADLGIFSRLGWDDGATETWAFTEVDDSFSLGASLRGTSWSRRDDVVGMAIIADGLSKDHADYLSAGGLGFIVGDGPTAGSPVVGPYLSYAPEYVFEAYYSCRVLKAFAVTGDFQFVKNPGYNADRGPVPIVALRLHFEI